MCVNNLSRVVTWKWKGRALNPRPLHRESTPWHQATFRSTPGFLTGENFWILCECLGPKQLLVLLMYYTALGNKNCTYKSNRVICVIYVCDCVLFDIDWSSQYGWESPALEVAGCERRYALLSPVSIQTQSLALRLNGNRALLVIHTLHCV